MADLTRYNPVRRMLHDFFNHENHPFHHHHHLHHMHNDVDFYPPVEVRSKDKEYLIEVEVPGVPRGDIDLSVEDHVLLVKGRKDSVIPEDEDIVMNERVSGSFERRLHLPENVVTDRMKAEYKDGVLLVTIPVKEEKKTAARKVKIS